MSEATAFSQPPPPQPKYQLLMELGKGGMGVVYLAMSRGPKGFVKLVVLKMLRRQLLGEDECHKMFMEEARISARLNHPNIVQIFEVTDVDDAPTIVMEYLEGQTLSALLSHQEAPLPLPLALHIVSRTLAGLHAAHELVDYDGTPLSLVHRDVSPHNIFVLFDGRVKVLDFGIAKAAGSEVETGTGELKGKIRYMAPEQVLRDPQDRRADLFSVGVVLWELLTRKRLWGRNPDGDIMRSLLNKAVPPLPAELEIPAELAAICRKALAPNPDDRYPTATVFQAELDRFIATLPSPPHETELGAWMREFFGGAREAARRVIDAHVKAYEPSSPGGRSAGPPLTSTRLRAVLPPLGPEDGDTKRLPAATETSDSGPPRGGSASGTGGTPAGSKEPPLHEGRMAEPSPTKERSPSPSGLGPWRTALIVLSLVTGGTALAIVLAQHRHFGPHRAVGVSAVSRAKLPAPSCPGGFKQCDGQCVSIDRPDYGCGSETCSPCRMGNATARCNGEHVCDIAICYQSYDDCDQNSRNGCEVNLQIDPDHCGSCEKRCPPLPHAQRGCGDVCTVWRCEPGFRDCNHEVEDGCEVETASDPRHCGHCGVACTNGQKCRGGQCIP